MRKARLITIGTEITCGEVVNSNAAWISCRLEDRGVRVLSHLSVRDHRDEILTALNASRDADLLVVTGGLGPTSDDITRECVAQHLGRPLEFDGKIWADLERFYAHRALPLRAAHRQQCHFPQGSRRLGNAVGTALGFQMEHSNLQIVVLPGPPRELQAMWKAEVEPWLAVWSPQESHRWTRWTTLGAPESEIAELVESVVAGVPVEVGYRAQVPYVKVKLYADPAAHVGTIAAVDEALKPYLVARGELDLAEELIRRWPHSEFHLQDELTGPLLAMRLLSAQRGLPVRISFGSATGAAMGLRLGAAGERFTAELRWGGGRESQTMTLPYGVKLASERGLRSAAEWTVWFAVKTLRTHTQPPS